MQGRCWRSQWNLRHPAKPFGPEFQPITHLGQFHSLINWSIDDLFICETKAFKLDLTILLVHGEPNEQQQSETLWSLFGEKPFEAFGWKFELLHLWNSMLQATSKLNRLEYLNITWHHLNIWIHHYSISWIPEHHLASLEYLNNT